MWTYIFSFIVLVVLSCRSGAQEREDFSLYYYGIEESERSLPVCGARAACGAGVERAWRGGALLRLCACARRRRCLAPAPAARRLPLNNRAYFQFCQSVASWPECVPEQVALTVRAEHARLDPDELERLHHRNIHLAPPNITFTCRCREPNYWKLNSTSGPNTKHYQCSSLPLCRTSEFCGNVDYDLNSLYQSCLCPRGDICVHNGGVARTYISELLYTGRGWKAYCQRLDGSDSSDYEE